MTAKVFLAYRTFTGKDPAKLERRLIEFLQKAKDRFIVRSTERTFYLDRNGETIYVLTVGYTEKAAA